MGYESIEWIFQQSGIYVCVHLSWYATAKICRSTAHLPQHLAWFNKEWRRKIRMSRSIRKFINGWNETTTWWSLCHKHTIEFPIHLIVFSSVKSTASHLHYKLRHSFAFNNINSKLNLCCRNGRISVWTDVQFDAIGTHEWCVSCSLFIIIFTTAQQHYKEFEGSSFQSIFQSYSMSRF